MNNYFFYSFFYYILRPEGCCESKKDENTELNYETKITSSFAFGEIDPVRIKVM
jgi:hypothetical protein